MSAIIDWDGEMIREPGLYRGIPLEVYHNDRNLLSGPSVSKSDLKHIAPPDGSPKKFWSFWAHNPKRLQKPKTQAMVFGSATHALLLGDEVFEERFIIRPEKVEGETYHGNKKVWRDWFKEQAELGLEVITKEDFAFIKAMAEDAAKHPFIIAGGLNGEVEISMFAKDPETGIWLRSRPDVRSATSTDYADLKTAASLNEGFLSRQLEGAGYFLQGALTRKVCQLLNLPFTSFSFVYVQSDEFPDTDFRVLSEEDMDIGDRVIRYGLRKIREGLASGVWEGAASYNRENYPIRMPKVRRDSIDNILAREGF